MLRALVGFFAPSRSVSPSENACDLKIQENLSNPTSELRTGWMPQDPAVVNRWLAKKVGQADKEGKPFAEVIENFKKFIENDAAILILFQQMFNQVPTTPPFDKDTWGNPSVSYPWT